MRRSGVDLANSDERNIGDLVFCLQLGGEFDYREDGGMAKTYLNRKGEGQIAQARRQLSEYLSELKHTSHLIGERQSAIDALQGMAIGHAKPVVYFSANHGVAQQTAYAMMRSVDEHFCFRELDASLVGTKAGPLSVSAWTPKAWSGIAFRMTQLWAERPWLTQRGSYCAVIETREALKEMALQLLDEHPEGYKAIAEIELQPGAVLCVRNGILEAILANKRTDSATTLTCIS